jgi:hypothetical protein
MHKQKGGEDDEFALKILLSQETNQCPFIPYRKDTLYSRRRHALTPSYIILLSPYICAYYITPPSGLLSLRGKLIL